MTSVLLQYTVLDCDRVLQLFEKTIKLPMEPFLGMILRGPNMLLPVQSNTPLTSEENIIARITACENQTLICHLVSGVEGAMTGDEMTTVYAKKGWTHQGPCRPDTPGQEDGDDTVDPLAN